MSEARDPQVRACDSVFPSWYPRQDITITRAYDPMLRVQTALDPSVGAQLDHNNPMRSRLCPPSVDKLTIKTLLDVIETVEKVFKEELEKLKRTPSAKKAEREKKSPLQLFKFLLENFLHCIYAGAPFSPNFQDVVKRLFSIYAHIYHSHFQKTIGLKEEAHLNTCFKHFVLFIWEFQLIDKNELAPLYEIVESILEF